ncbi:MAG: glycosyltransferase [Planctomycetota bacterium]
MRVLLISHTCQSPTEGQPKAVELDARPGLELRVVVPHRWKHYGRWRPLEVLPEARGLIRPLRVVWPWLGPVQNYLHWYPALGRTIRDFRPDVIDVWEEPWSLVSAQAARLRRRLAPDAILIVETEQNLDKALPPPFEALRRYSLRHADWMIGRNEEAVAVCRAKGYAGPASVLPNAVDTHLFQPGDRASARRALGLDGFVLGYVGRLVPEKGIDDLIAALPHLPERASALIIGGGDDEGRLRQLAEGYGLGVRVRFAGELPLAELPQVMNGIDALVLPSRTTARWKEQYGRVLIEAKACGIPAIGSDSGAIPEVIGDPAQVFAEGRPEALAACVRRLMDDPRLHAAERRAARRRRVEATVSWSRVAERYHEVYRRARTHHRGDPAAIAPNDNPLLSGVP